MKKILVLSNVNKNFASIRQRVYEPLGILSNRGGVKYYRCSFYSDKTSRILKTKGISKYFYFFRDLIFSIPKLFFYWCKSDYDVIVVKNHYFPIGSAKIEKVAHYLFRKSKFIFDIDDAIYLNQKTAFNKLAILIRNPHEKVKFWVEICDVLIVSNKYILKDLDGFCNLKNKSIHQTISLVSKFAYINSSEDMKEIKVGNVINFIWLGSPHTEKNLLIWSDFLIKLTKFENIVIYIIGSSKGFDLFDCYSNIKRLDWSPSIEKEILRKAHFGLNPLQNTDFEIRKSAFKVIQYYRAGVFPIVSNVGINKDLISEFGGALIDDIQIDDLQSWLKFDIETHKRIFNKSHQLSTTTVSKIFEKIIN